MSQRDLILVVILFSLLNLNCPCVSAVERVNFVTQIQPILETHCYTCHGPDKQQSGLRLDIKAKVFEGGDGYGPSLVEGSAAESPLFELISTEDASVRMPPDSTPLSNDEVDLLRRWIDQGADWPDGADSGEWTDPLDHWSFKPLRRPNLPPIGDSSFTKHPIDAFVIASLEKHGLHPSPAAKPTRWLRRVTFDLTGLPPTPAEIAAFELDLVHGESAYARVVDRLLSRPSYGERWAQHWLDVVRYADTHGFEVNTERENAWPYRDYVIDALNRDLPFDEFVHEQLAGDQLGADAATGFLVTASVLLPGQIGKDAPSMRLARQDALDEIVNNIGQSFLGLTIGCARCHSHKFDPISARDYYGMQAFVAGVEYTDRNLSPDLSSEQLAAIQSLETELREIDSRLVELTPIARPNASEPLPSHRVSSTVAPSSNERTTEFTPQLVNFVRFTINDCNLHPTLGLIEPCIDEFEIFAEDPALGNVALASHGTLVTSSGSNESTRHKLVHVNDGRYGNSRSWMSDTAGKGWLLFELPEPVQINKIVWSRDREGQFSDRTPIAYRLEAGTELSQLRTLDEKYPQRLAVQAEKNTDRFLPVLTERLRFNILETNSLEPCIDEIEVFNTAGENVARKAGVIVNTSGDRVEPGRHEPKFVNDGQYGNERSWMSSEVGSGWIELTFPAAEEVHCVTWGRDRNGKYNDRLPIGYKILVEHEGSIGVVADHTDRHPWAPSKDSFERFSSAALTLEETKEARQLLAQRKETRAQLASLREPPRVFAGVFRKPDEIHVLRRGDPEQPLEKVGPMLPSKLSQADFPTELAEPQRRLRLAEWITDADNPLTARVIANRVWQWHFGAGFVSTPNDFGHNGATPTHPALLDWLACELIDSNWSLKHLHRAIVLSHTYRQSSAFNREAANVDADARLLWRFPLRRLEAEAIRDAMLAVSGRLNRKMTGPGFNFFKQRGGLSGFTPVQSFTADGLRRMIYAHKVRREPDAIFGAFDCPDGGQSTPSRSFSTTPIQALNLLNSQFTLATAEALAERISSAHPTSTSEQVRSVFIRTLGRFPNESEMDEIAPVVSQHGLEVLCRAIFNSNEFLFIQ